MPGLVPVPEKVLPRGIIFHTNKILMRHDIDEVSRLFFYSSFHGITIPERVGDPSYGKGSLAMEWLTLYFL